MGNGRFRDGNGTVLRDSGTPELREGDFTEIIEHPPDDTSMSGDEDRIVLQILPQKEFPEKPRTPADH